MISVGIVGKVPGCRASQGANYCVPPEHAEKIFEVDSASHPDRWVASSLTVLKAGANSQGFFLRYNRLQQIGTCI